MWPVVIVILVVAMMVGPIMIMQPSKGQKRLAALRTFAQSEGVRVNASQIKEADGGPCWFYWLSLAKKDQLPVMLLERKNYAHGLHVAEFWAFKGDSVKVCAAVEGVLRKLPDSVCAFEVNAHAVGVHWTEAGGQKTLEAWLAQLKLLLDAG